jgi:hypothetical protein
MTTLDVLKFDFDSIDGIDDADDESLLLLIRDLNTGDFGWHWLYRDTLADNGLYELAGHGLSDTEAAARRWL